MCQTTSFTWQDLIPYLLKKLDYILTANLQSDPIEARFGSYRRAAGTNYFNSVQQILEAVKTTQIQSLVTIDGLIVQEIKEVFIDISPETTLTVVENSR